MIAQVGWDRITHAPFVRALEPLDEAVAEAEGKAESHLVVLRLAENTISITWENDLGPARLERLDHAVGAVDSSGKTGRNPAALFEKRRNHQQHHLGGIAVDHNNLGLEIRSLKRSAENGLVFFPGELGDGSLGSGARFLCCGVHSCARATLLKIAYFLLEAIDYLRQGAADIFVTHRHRPPIAPGHRVTHTCCNLHLQITERASALFGHRFPVANHPYGKRKSLRAHIPGERFVQTLKIGHEVFDSNYR